MHKQRLNELTLYGILQPFGPILIKSGTESGADPTLPSMNFVRTRHPTTGERTIYLPGSSLKGTIRSHVERIIRTVQGTRPEICCDPLSKDNSCGKRLEKKNLTTAEEYKGLCLACRIFGHMVHASHFTSADAYPTVPIDALAVRQGVAINRFSGGVGVGPFETEVATSGKFQLRIMLTNFELWQVGLLALALRDLGEGRLLLGFGKSRGMGRVRLNLTGMEIAYPGRFDNFDPVSKIYGMGTLADGLITDYGLTANDSLSMVSGGSLVPDSQLWGRPAAMYGMTASNGNGQDIDRETSEAYHETIMAALAGTVQAWGKYKKPGA